MWNSYSTPLQNPGRIDDRHAEARARRLAAEARPDERTTWRTRGYRAVTRSGGALLARVGHVHVEPGSTLRVSRLRV
jgi:hypothetical protein